MYYAKVIGKTYSNVIYPALKGIQIKIIQDIDVKTKKFINSPKLALDALNVNIGEYICYEVSLEGTWAFDNKLVPSDATIVAIVDSLYIENI